MPRMLAALILFVHLFSVEISCQAVISPKDSGTLEFTQSIYRGLVKESFPFTNASIRDFVTIDPPMKAGGNATGAVQYSILSGNDDGVFAIDPLTGQLVLVLEIDRENLPQSAVGGRFNLVVQASAAEWEPAQARVLIDIADVNDNEPRFNPEKYAISIVENLPPGFNVLRVTASDPDSAENGRFEYRLTDPSGAFRIEPLTGWLSVADSAPLDRENITSIVLLVEAVEELPSLVSSNRSRPSVRIDIDLTDANDNSPVFQPTNLYSFSLEAGAVAGTVVGQVLAVDADAGENGLVSYAIQHHEEGGKWNNFTVGANVRVPFSVHPRSGHVIVVDAPLVAGSYQLVVEASDEPANPSERRVSLAIVQITVESRSVKVPVFLNTPYEFWIGASAPVDTSVGQVKASASAGSNIRYALKQNPSKPVPLNLDPRTGILRVTDVLASFAGATYFLNVTASESRSEQVSTSIVVHIVQDSIGRSPNAARSNDRPLIYHFNVTENIADTVVGRIAYPGAGFDSYEYFPLDPISANWLLLKIERNGTLLTRKGLDREQLSNLTELVTVRDKDRAVDTVQLIVTVLDANDNAPVFSQSRYVGRVKENAPAGTLVRLDRRIECSDADEWPANRTRLSLSGNGSRQFRIDPSSGELSVARSRAIDRERTPSYNLVVTATDDKFTSTAELTIVVDDVNDNPPEIVSFFPALGAVALERSLERTLADHGDSIVICADGSCSAPIGLDETDSKLLAGRSTSTFNKVRNQLLSVMDKWLSDSNATAIEEELVLDKAFQEVLHNATILIQVPEDFPVNGTIGTFRTGDRDTVPSTGLRFALLSAAEEDLPFGIRQRNGSLVLRRNLVPDKTYSFHVRVADSQGLTSETHVALQAVDVNNHRPVFERPFYEFHLDEGLYRLAPLFPVEATDRDWGDNARLTYSLSNRTVHPFEIDVESGMLFVDGLIDREQVEFFRFTVHVTDHGWPPLRNQVEVVIYVADVNDNAPRFELPPDDVNNTNNQPIFNASIADGTPPGVPVIRIKASDADVDTRTNGNVTYKLASHHQLFGIDPSTGSVFTKSMIDFNETGGEMNVVVVALDHGTPSLSTVGVVNVKVVKGCRGGLTPRRQETISLDEDVSFPLLLVNLTSHESEGERGLQLLLVGIEPPSPMTQSLFSVGHTEPVLWLTGPLDYETEPKYIVYLKVQQSETNNRKAETMSCWETPNEELIVYVFVNDVNDNAPVFRESDPYVTTIAADSPIGSVVLSVSATDQDTGENGEILYSLTDVTQNENELAQDATFSLKPPFAIDSKTGSLTVVASLEQFTGRILLYRIAATDRNGAGLSTYIRVSIHVLGHVNQVAIVLGTRMEELVNHSANISRTVSDITGMDVWVKSVEPHVEGDAINTAISEVLLYAKNQSGTGLISSEDFSRVLNAKRSDLSQRLQRYELKAIRNLHQGKKSLRALSTSRMEVLEVTLIALAVAILMGALVAVVFAACARARLKEQKGLLPRSAFTIGMDYHLQPLRNITAPFNHSVEDALVESSSLSSDLYAEASSDKGDADFFVSSLPPTKERHRRNQPEIPMCTSCRRREKIHCRCNCGRKVRRSSSQRRSSTAAVHKKVKRHHSFTEYSCGHQYRKPDAVNKQVRLHMPHRSHSLVLEPAENIVRELERRVAEEDEHHKQQRSRKSSSGVSTLDVRRQLFQHSDVPDHQYSSSSGGFDDSLDSDRRRARNKR